MIICNVCNSGDHVFHDERDGRCLSGARVSTSKHGDWYIYCDCPDRNGVVPACLCGEDHL